MSMSKRKYDKAKRLDKLIGVRVSGDFYDNLESLRKNSNCRTLGEFARAVLERKEIIWYHKDSSHERVAVELSGVRRELRAIGSNINQVTRYFNGTTIPSQKIFEALKILDEFKRANATLAHLQQILSTHGS